MPTLVGSRPIDMMPRTSSSDLLTVEDTALALRCSVRSIRYMQAAGEMPFRVRRGRRLFYKRAEIMKMLREQR